MTWEEYKALLPIKRLRMLAEDFGPEFKKNPEASLAASKDSPVHKALMREYPTADYFEVGMTHIRLHADGPNSPINRTMPEIQRVLKEIASSGEGYLYSKVYS